MSEVEDNIYYCEDWTVLANDASESKFFATVNDALSAWRAAMGADLECEIVDASPYAGHHGVGAIFTTTPHDGGETAVYGETVETSEQV